MYDITGVKNSEKIESIQWYWLQARGDYNSGLLLCNRVPRLRRDSNKIKGISDIGIDTSAVRHLECFNSPSNQGMKWGVKSARK